MNIVQTLKGITLVVLLLIFVYAVSLFELWTQIGRYQNYWTKNNQKAAVQGELLYVALGDSTAQGIGATRATNGYVAVIAEGLEEKRNQPVRTVNLSKSGAKVKDVLDTQLPNLEKLTINQETVVTMGIGANDMINFDKDAFEKDMDQVMSKLPKQTLIADIPYFGGSRYASRQQDVNQANAIMYELTNKHNLRLVGLHLKLRQSDSIRQFAPDWFHPSNSAYRDSWAPVFLERL